MATLNDTVLLVDEVDLEALNIYDPTASNAVTPQRVVQFAASDTEDGQSAAFIVKIMGADRVLMELPEDIALDLQKSYRALQDAPERNDDDPVTELELSHQRLNHHFDVAAVLLGLLRPQLSPEQVEALPLSVLRKLSDVIVDAPSLPTADDDDTDESDDTDDTDTDTDT